MPLLKRPFQDVSHAMGWWVDDVGAFDPYVAIANDADDLTRKANPFSTPSDSRVALRHYGMVHVERLVDGVKITWDVERVDPRSLSAVQNALRSGELSGRVRLFYRYGGWARESHPTPQDALKRIDHLRGFRTEIPKGIISTRDLDPVNLPGAKSLLRQSLCLWQTIDPARLELFDSPFRDVMPFGLTLAETHTPGSLFYRSVGRSAHIVSYLGRDWARDVVGTLSSQGYDDVEFDYVISEPYFEALASGKPHYDHVRALFVIDPEEPVWVNYQRLLLPYTTAGGAPALAIMVAPDQNVRIPFMEKDPA